VGWAEHIAPEYWLLMPNGNRNPTLQVCSLHWTQPGSIALGPNPDLSVADPG
jgi:hypothetical protein